MKLIRSITVGLAAVAVSALALADGAPRHKRAAAAPAKDVSEASADVPAANADQLQAMALTLLGSFDCGDKDELVVTRSPDHDGYVVVRHGKQQFMMRPVRSETGAVRLEDVRGEMLMVQIPSKSMLMDTKLGKRVADACRNDVQKKEVVSADSLGISAPGQVDTNSAGQPASPLVAKR